MTTLRLLIVDDNEVDREAVRRLLRGRYELLEASTIREALEQHAQRPADCVLLDYRLPDAEGLGSIARFDGAAVVILTGQGNERVAVEAMRSGAQDYVVKGTVGSETLHRILGGAVARRRLEAELSRSEDYNRALLRALPDSTIRLSHDGTCLDFLPGSAWDGQAGGAAIGEPIQEALPNAAWSEQLAAALAGEEEPFDCVVDGAAGLRTLQVRLASAGQEVVGLVRDVTEERQLEEKLATSRQLEALGRLAGGVAHDFNNMLSVIMGHASFGQARVPPEADAHRRFATILAACERSADLTQRLLAFGRQLVLQPRVVDVQDVLLETETLITRTLGADLAVRCVSAPGLLVRVDPGQLHHALLNLALNARDAMPEGGELKFEATREVLNEALAGAHPDAQPGAYVQIAVSDNGTGMPPEVMERALEPFFTTKVKGRGTGLGLASVHGFIRQSGGFMSGLSRVGGGTTFKLYLPATAATVQCPSPARGYAMGGGEAILLVEDEAPLRELLEETLRDSGYRVFSAPDGEVALQLLAQRGGELSLVLTDIVLPKGDGREVLREARLRCAQAALMCMSGYAPRTLEERGELDPDVVFIQKPFSPADLARRVGEVLRAGAGQTP